MDFAQERCACPIVDRSMSMADSCGSQFIVFMSILETIIRGRCDLADPCNRINSRDPDESYDFVVVGAGASGSVIAARLSENPQWKVLLIEAGENEPTVSQVPALLTWPWSKKETDWMYYTEKQEKACLLDDGKCYWPRGKMLGGSTGINGMMYLRGHKADYDGWAAGGAKGWAWNDVFKYFLMSEDNKEIGSVVSSQYHNRGGPLPVRRFNDAPELSHDIVSASIELGYRPTTDLTGDVPTGFTIAQALTNNGSRYSSARAFLRPASKRQNLHFTLESTVSRVILDPLAKKVVAVEYIKDGQTKTVKVNKEAIISAGALNTPQILLLSGIGPRETLDKFNIPTLKELPGVGQNLQNHIGVSLNFEMSKTPETNSLNWVSAMEYMLTRRGPLSSTGMSQLTGMVNTKYAPADGQQPDVQIFFYGYDASCGDAPYQNDLGKTRDLGMSVICLQPKSRGYVTLQSTDPLQPPLMQPNYFHDEHDLDVIVEGARVAYKLANTTILREKYGLKPQDGYGEKCGDSNGLTDDYLKCLAKYHTAPENHQAGSCKMGPASDPMAVVDMQLKVHGIEGLRVSDTSIMPTVVTSNTAGPAIMIGERTAEFIKIQHSKKSPGLEDRFGVQTGGAGSRPQVTKPTNEGNEKWDYSYESEEVKDDKLTDNHNEHQAPWHDRWKPWDNNWHKPNWNNPMYNKGPWQTKSALPPVQSQHYQKYR